MHGATVKINSKDCDSKDCYCLLHVLQRKTSKVY